MDVRPLHEGEGPRLRELRLRALADAPDAFGRSFEEDAAHDDAWWAQLAAEGRVQVAEDGGRLAGMAGGRLCEDGSAELWGMWVEPAARGTGVAERLVEAVAAWARERGASRVELQVAQPDGAAARLYRRLGFADTGRRADGGCKLRLGRDL
jgi:ribosomal protein S18 acetylase RimI-like enzyme